MNIRKVSLGLIASTLMAGAFSSCNETKYEDKAKAQAVKYLNGDQLLKAERFARQQANFDEDNGEAVAYWDSLLLEAKSKEAYIKGQQLIKDSLNNKHYRKEKVAFSLDTILPRNVAENSKNEYANYVNAEDFIKARDKAPDNYHNPYYNHRATSVHYWNLITIAAKQNEAYQKGMADERANIKEKSCVNSLPKNIVYNALQVYNSAVITKDVVERNRSIDANKSVAEQNKKDNAKKLDIHQSAATQKNLEISSQLDAYKKSK